MRMVDKLKVDRSRFIVASSFEEAAEQDAEHWMSLTAQQRLFSLEIMRQMAYGYDPASTRLQRLFEVVERP